MNSFKFLAIFLFLFLSVLQTKAQVTPPNYDFSLDQLAPFFPNNTLSDLQKKFGPGKILEEASGVKLYKFEVNQIRYKFTVLVQIYQEKTLDFYAKLPTHFLHNIFHQTLINKYGPQDEYYKQEKDAIYIWNKKTTHKHLYSGSCIITCFPRYYSVIPKELTFRPIIEKIKTTKSEFE